jgi:putative tricarboxylic transport membrane protein
MVSMVIFGIVGYLLKKYRYETAPLAIAFVLGPMLERSLRQSLSMSDGSFKIFVKSPLAGSCLMIALILLLLPVFPLLKRKRKSMVMMQKEED